MRGKQVEPYGRRAFVCPHKECNPPNVSAPLRIFLNQGETQVPRCNRHGPMVRQENVPYGRTSKSPA